MRAGLLRHSVTIQEKSTTRDAYGGEVVSWVPFATVPAKVEPLRLREYIAARAGQADLTLRASIRYLAGVTAEMRLVWQTDPYPIVEVIDVDGRHRELELLCTGEAQPT